MPFPSFNPPKVSRPGLLLVKELPIGQAFDEAATADERHWQASPHSRFERLLRETRVPIGLLVNGTHIRLVYAPRGENSGYVTFRIADMVQVSGRPIFAALDMLLCEPRLFSLDVKQRLPAILEASRKYQSVVSTKLAEQVLAALYELLRGFQAADEARRGELLTDVLKHDPNHVYNGLLTVLMRLVFVLYAEDRNLLSSDPLYSNHYSVTGLFERLRADAGKHPDTMDQRYGAWSQLLTLFRLIFDGAPELALPPRLGYLFDPDRYNFLEGRSWKQRRTPGEKLHVPRLSDGVIFRVLSNLLILDGERLSYRTLDVEQIGSVYETMMGFNVEVATGRSIAIKPAKSHGAPSAINLEALLGVKAADRAKWLKEYADQSLTGSALDALKSASTVEDLLAALEKKIAKNATPSVVSRGSMVLQPSDERRKSGSHYTPRELTEPVVRKALDPILRQLGSRPTPDDILNLKVCDPAMGSGAFLVEACRYLGERLVRSWNEHIRLPAIPPDEDEILHARRTIAQRCLYGVDKNPMAVDLAKLSLWLATLAKDHPFTFLDHTLRCGDSLVGLTRQQLSEFHWQHDDQLAISQQVINQCLNDAAIYRQKILSSADNVTHSTNLMNLAAADNKLDILRHIGDLVVDSFFSSTKDNNRLARRNANLEAVAKYLRIGMQSDGGWTASQLPTRISDTHPFHWEIEFPEVFDRAEKGFDAVVGNPPFLGGSQLSELYGGPVYQEWLKVSNAGAFGNADLAAYFFRKAHLLVRKQGTFGQLATKSISEGSSRVTGLQYILKSGGVIYNAISSQAWPGDAAVRIAVVHIASSRKTEVGSVQLNGREVTNISSRLLPTAEMPDPQPLSSNSLLAFKGVDLGSSGFILNPDEFQRLANEPTNREHLMPFLGGEEINSSPSQGHSRYAINFGSCSLEHASRFPALLEVVRERVKPMRDQGKDHGPGNHGKKYWWQFTLRRDPLYESIHNLSKCLVSAVTTHHLSFSFQMTRQVFPHSVVVFAFDGGSPFSILQSRIHDSWARFLSSSMGGTLRYSIQDAFQTFPFPSDFATSQRLEVAGTQYYEFRSIWMADRSAGLTEIYNRFHNPDEQSADILKLRELHAAMDRAVLDAYGWTDIPTDCQFLLDYEEDEDDEEDAPSTPKRGRGKKKPWRYRWPDEVRDEVLARLLALNAERAKIERAAAVPVTKTSKGKQKAKPNDGQLFEGEGNG